MPDVKKSKEQKKVFDINILIGGAAGQGIQTLGVMLLKILFRCGLFVTGLQDYQSRIVGGHNTFRVRVSNEPLTAPTERIDILIALNHETYYIHLPKVIRGGFILYDAGSVKPDQQLENLVGLPLAQIAQESVNNKKTVNTVLLGALGNILGIDNTRIKNGIAEKFSGKDESVIAMNKTACEAGRLYIDKQYAHLKKIVLPVDERFIKKQETAQKSKTPRTDGSVLVNGAEAGGYGMLSAGVRFYAAYPMTPSTGLLNYMAAHAEQYSVLVEQAEDEIAAIQMALGASYAGARSAVGTSGGGFALMVESVSLAGITETPIVIYVMQRPGPATGLPTRTEQADLEFVLHAGHGEFPRFVFAPGDPSQMYDITLHAFNLADKYQLPVFILGDQYLADTYQVMKMFDVGQTRINRSIVPPEKNTADYKRYQLTADGISPRALPGRGAGLVVVDSDEHDEAGHLTEDLAIRVTQQDKRMKKKESMMREMEGPIEYGDPQAETRLICWGSTLGIAQEAVDILRRKGEHIGLIHFSYLWPFPKQEAIRALSGCKRLIGVENNMQGQLCRLIAQETGINIQEKILKYNGMQFFPQEIVDKIYGNNS